MTRPSNLSYHPTALAAQQEEPEPIEPLRSRVAKPAKPPLARTDSLFDERLREELEMLRRYVETSAYLLGQDAAMRYRHGTEIGNLRHVEKVLGQLSPLVTAADKAAAIERLTDAELKARLLRKPIAEWYESKH